MNIQLSISYATKILQYLHENNGVANTGRIISKSTGIPYQRFIMIASQLTKSGLVYSVRGRTGGHFLAQPIEKVGLLDIYMALQGDGQVNRCFNTDRLCTVDAIDSCCRNGFICTLQAGVSAEKSRQTIRA